MMQGMPVILYVIPDIVSVEWILNMRVNKKCICVEDHIKWTHDFLSIEMISWKYCVILETKYSVTYLH